MLSAESVRPPAWLVAPVKLLIRRFPRLNATMWNAEYKLGIWNYLDAETHTGSEVLALVEKYTPQARILDLGCGTSANLPLQPGRYRHYHGVDVSAAAVRAGEALGRPATSFEAADILTYTTNERFDAILLREVVYYFPAGEVSGLLHRLAGLLDPGGKIFIQMFESTDYGDVVRECGLPIVEFRTEGGGNGTPGAALIVLAGDGSAATAR